MPTIRTYEAPALGLQPTEVGISAAVNAARTVGKNADQAAAAVSEVGGQFARNLGGAVKAAGEVAVQYVEHREISRGAAGYAQLNDKLTQQWNDTAKNADPNDPTVAEKFRQEVLEPSLQKYSEGFISEGGQKFAQSRVDSLRNHMFTKTAADMSSLAADAVAVNVRQTGNSLSNTAINDPSAVPHLLESADSLVGGMVESAPNLKGAVASKAKMELSQKIKESIVKSGAIGAIEKSADPEATAKAWGAKYPEFISGDELKMLSGNARQQIRARRADETNARVLQDRQAQKASDNRETEYLQKLYSDDPKEQGQVSTKAIVNDPTLNRVAKERMIGVVNREFKPETAAQASNGNAMELLDRLRRPEGDPERIDSLDELYKARIDGKLNKTDFEMLRKEFAEVRTPEGEKLTTRKTAFMAAVKSSITGSNPLMGKIDKDGDLNSYRLMVDLDAKIAEYKKAGKNPYDLLDPSKPDYMGRPEALLPYQKTLQESIRSQGSKLSPGGRNLTGGGSTVTGVEVTNAPAIVPRKPGESPADYLKRTGNR